ncbi:hypothetical protein S83_035615, partial [Arachis hypogaea]
AQFLDRLLISCCHCGFMSGVAIIISFQQLKGLLGIPHFNKKTDIISGIGSWNLETIIIGTSCLIFLLITKYIPFEPALVCALEHIGSTILEDLSSSTYIIGVETCCIGNSCLKMTSLKAQVDSGTSFTFLPGHVYESIAEEFDKKLNASRATFKDTPWEYCYAFQ